MVLALVASQSARWPASLPLSAGRTSSRAGQAGGLGICTPTSGQLGSPRGWKGTGYKADSQIRDLTGGLSKPPGWHHTLQDPGVSARRHPEAEHQQRQLETYWKLARMGQNPKVTPKSRFSSSMPHSPPLNSGGAYTQPQKGQTGRTLKWKTQIWKCFECGLDRFL